MDKEIGKMMEHIELLGELPKRPVAVLALRFSNIPRPVSYDELHAKLDRRYATIDKEGPLESEVKSELVFLVGQGLLEVVEEEYQITPYGAELARELSPRTKTKPKVI